MNRSTVAIPSKTIAIAPVKKNMAAHPKPKPARPNASAFFAVKCGRKRSMFMA